jgi:membrane fusion protein (multidrug efflux system)
MKKRMFVMLGVVVLLLATLAFVKVRQIQAAIAQGSAWQPPPEAVTTIVAAEETWEPTLDSVGWLTAVNGVSLSGDLPGTVDRILFKAGDSVKTGQVLVQLDRRQEEAQLRAAEAARDLARLNRDRFRGLLEKGVSSQAEFDNASAAFDVAQANVGLIQASIQRKSIRAPFAGILGMRKVELGQYLNSGQEIVSLQALDPIYANFGVPQQDLPQMTIGREIRVTAAGADAAGDIVRTGKITAVDSVVDSATRNVQIQATIENKDGRLRPGMYVQTRAVLDAKQAAIPLPATAINYAPYGDSVFVVEELKGPDGAPYKGVRQAFVKLGPARGDQVAVTSGIKPGEEIVTSGPFKLRNGASVLVNNETTPANSPAPTPEDN